MSANCFAFTWANRKKNSCLRTNDRNTWKHALNFHRHSIYVRQSVPRRNDRFATFWGWDPRKWGLGPWNSNSAEFNALPTKFHYPILARSANLPTGLYILPSEISSFLKSTEYISASTGPIFTIFLPYEMYMRDFFDPDLFFQFLKGRCHGNRFWAKYAKWPLFNTLETDSYIAISIQKDSMAIFVLHTVQIWSRLVQ